MQLDPTTFAFELVNFVVLLWILTRFVYRPISSALVTRREELAAARAEADRRLAEAERRKVELDARSLELDRLRQEVLGEATAEAAAERERLLAQAREDASAERARVQATLASEREAAVAWVRHVAIERGAEVAGHLLLELAPEAAHGALVRRLGEEVTARAELLRHAVQDGKVRAEVTWARPPSDEDRQRVEEALGSLGGRPELSSREDPELGAGVVVRLGDQVLDASIAGQLAVLRERARARLDGLEERA